MYFSGFFDINYLSHFFLVKFILQKLNEFFSFYLSSAIKSNDIKDAVKLIKNNNNLLDDVILYDASYNISDTMSS